MSHAIIRLAQSKGYRVSVLLNGMYPVNNINEVRSLFSDVLVQEDMYVFSALAPTAYCVEDNHDRDKAAEAQRAIAIANIRPDIVFITNLFEGYVDDYTVSIPDVEVPWKTVCVCHDLIPLLNKQRYLSEPLFNDFYMRKLEEFERADAVVATSISTVGEVLANTRLPEERVVDISSAAGHEFKKINYSDAYIKAFRKRHKLPKKYVLSLAMIEPRKNVEALIQAYSMLPKAVQKSYPLVFAYRIYPEDVERLQGLAKQHGLSPDRLIFTGYLPDDDLIALYNLCSLFVFPSLHEGFGLPVLEAMQCGAPTITSNVTSLPYVIGWDEATFDPYDVNDIARVLKKSLMDQDFHARLKTHAFEQAKNFSWEKTASTAMSVFEKVNAERIQTPIGIDQYINEQVNNIRNISSFDDASMLEMAWSLARNTFGKHNRKLLVDVSILREHDAKTGIQRVSRNILRELLKIDVPGYQVAAVYYRSGECYRYANDFMNTNFGTHFGDDEPVLFTKDDVMVVTDLTAHFFPELNNELDRIRSIGTKACFVIHDIMPMRHPEWSSEGINRVFPIWLTSLAEHADRLICVSGSVAEEVRGWLEENSDTLKPNPGLEVFNFHLGADIPREKDADELSEQQKQWVRKVTEIPCFLMVGTIEPRKGHEQVLNAFELLWQKGVQANLFIVGKPGWMVDSLCRRIRHHPQINKHLFWPKDVSDELLTELYDACSALIFASYGEGFGLPLIEAAQRNLPVIVRDIPVFREIGQHGAFFFSGFEANDIATAITQWIGLYQRNEHPKPEDVHWLTWRQSAELLVEQLPLIPAERNRRMSECVVENAVEQQS